MEQLGSQSKYKGEIMERCPKCSRFGIEFDPYSTIYRCLWNDCLYVPKDMDEVKSTKHPIKFDRFIKSIKRKTKIA